MNLHQLSYNFEHFSYSSHVALQNNSVPGKGHENMCFANSALQVLFSFSNFVQHVLESLPSPSTRVVSKIKELFMDMYSSRSVNTFKYVTHLSLPGYVPYQMFDSQEFLVHVLNSLYPTLDQDCMFKIDMLSSISCHGNSCRHSIDSVESLHHLSLSLDPNKFSFSISELLLNYQLTEEMNDYRCEGCVRQGTCIREMTISDTSDVIILQVKAFQIINGLVMKNNSKVLLDSVLNDFYGKKYSLHGVIYHIGTSA
jgi:ubiquitin C-terminal hydrolase